MAGTINVVWIGTPAGLLRSATRPVTGPRVRTVARYGDLPDALARSTAWNAQVCIVEESLIIRYGLGFVRDLRVTKADLRFLLLGEHAHPQHVHAALLGGVDGLLPQNTGHSQLTTAIRTVAGGHLWIPAPILTAWVEHQRGLHAPLAEGLTEREHEVLRLLAQGLTYKGIGEQLHISPFTVKNQAHRIYQKLGVQNRTQAVQRYLTRHIK